MRIEIKGEKIFLEKSSQSESAALISNLEIDEDGSIRGESLYSASTEELQVLGIEPAYRHPLHYQLSKKGTPGFSDYRLELDVRLRQKSVSEISLPLIKGPSSWILLPRSVYQAKQLSTELTASTPEDSQYSLTSEIIELLNMRSDVTIQRGLGSEVRICPELSLNGEVTKDGVRVWCEILGFTNEEVDRAINKWQETGKNLVRIERDGIGYSWRPSTRQKRTLRAYKRRKRSADSIRINREEVTRYLTSIFPNELPEMPIDVEFGERVVGFGVFNAPIIPTFRPLNNDTPFVELIIISAKHSLSDDGNPRLEKAEVRLQSKEEAQELKAMLEEAEQHGLTEVTYKDHIIPLGECEPLRSAVSKALEQLPNEMEIKASRAKPQSKQVLLAKENLTELNYEICSRDASSMVKRSVAELPDAIRNGPIKARLKTLEYQLDGLNWFIDVGSVERQTSGGGLLADVMGLGKTLQAISYMAWLKETSHLSPALIVAPKSLVQNWEQEINTFCGPGVLGHIRAFESLKGEFSDLQEIKNFFEPDGIMILSYEQLRIHINKFAAIKFEIIIFDEAQRFKNPAIQMHNDMRALTAKRKFALTGTPVENRLSDLWAIMDVVRPGLLGTQTWFAHTFEKRLQNLNAESKDRDIIVSELKQALGKYFLRRTKKILIESGQLKQKKTVTTPYEFTAEQCAKIEELNSEILSQSTNKGVISLVQKLPYIASNPFSYPRADGSTLSDSMHRNLKLQLLLSKLVEIRAANEKALIFETRRDTVVLLKEALEEKFPELNNIHFISGEIMSSFRRAEIVDEFQRSQGFNVLILTPRTGGTGLTITAANHVFHFTRDWNPAMEAQSNDRAHRVGQTRRVSIYHFIGHYPESQRRQGKKTIEEYMDLVITSKIKLADDFTQPSCNFDSNLLEEVVESELGLCSQRRIYPSECHKFLNGYEFESYCAILLMQKYNLEADAVQLTSTSNDRGADIILQTGTERIVSQCKLKTDPNRSIDETALNDLKRFGEHERRMGRSVDRFVIVTNTDSAPRTLLRLVKDGVVDLILGDDLSQIARDFEAPTMDEIRSFPRTRQSRSA